VKVRERRRGTKRDGNRSSTRGSINKEKSEDRKQKQEKQENRIMEI
jgi:hypothetical protein